MRERTPTVIIGSYSLGREGIRRIIGTSRFDIVASAGAFDDVSLTLADFAEPPLLILIVDDDFNSVRRAIVRFREQAPGGRIAILGRRWDLTSALDAFAAGADACLAEGADGPTFVKSLELIMLGETIWPRGVLSKLQEKEDDGATAAECPAAPEVDTEREQSSALQFSRQETRILDCLSEGDSNKLIARKLEIAEATVKVHVKAILRKIRVRNRTQAAVWALQRHRVQRAAGQRQLVNGPASGHARNGAQ